MFFVHLKEHDEHVYHQFNRKQFASVGCFTCHEDITNMCPNVILLPTYDCWVDLCMFHIYTPTIFLTHFLNILCTLLSYYQLCDIYYKGWDITPNCSYGSSKTILKERRGQITALYYCIALRWVILYYIILYYIILYYIILYYIILYYIILYYIILYYIIL